MSLGRDHERIVNLLGRHRFDIHPAEGGQSPFHRIIVPIIDMRIKFNLHNVEYDQFTVVIILNLTNRVVGLVVDSVSDVITLEAQQIRATPELGSSIDAEYILGMGSLDARMLILVDIEKFMINNGMDLIDSSSHQI